MSFLVYLFVLLVAAGSVIFGLDWTQAPLNPPPYATPPAQSAAVRPSPQPQPAAQQAKAPAAAQAGVAVAQATVNGGAAAPAGHDEATRAQASVTDQTDHPETTAAVANCNVAACSASYRSFRAADCTYQPFDGPRRVCTKTSGSVAAAARPRSTRHVDMRGESRVTDRRGYGGDSRVTDRRGYSDERRSGWVFDFFGRGNDDDYR